MVLGFALAAVAVPAGAWAAGRPKGPEETATFYLFGPKHKNRNVLGLRISPRQGAVTLFAEENDLDLENDRGVAYAMRIPRGPLGNRLDIHLPGLGRIVPEKSEHRVACSEGARGSRRLPRSDRLPRLRRLQTVACSPG